MEVFFCDGCGTRLTEQNLEIGGAVRIGTESYCKDCLATRPELAQLASRARKTPKPKTRNWSADAVRAAEEAEPETPELVPPKAGAGVITIGVAVVAALGALVAALVLGRRSGPEEEPRWPAARARPPVRSVVPTAGRRGEGEAPARRTKPPVRHAPTATPGPAPRAGTEEPPPPVPVRRARTGELKLVYVQDFATAPDAGGWRARFSSREGHGAKPGFALGTTTRQGREIVFSPEEAGEEIAVGHDSYIGFAVNASGVYGLVVSVTTPRETYKQTFDLKQGEWIEHQIDVNSMITGSSYPEPGQPLRSVRFSARGRGALHIDSFFYAVNASQKDIASVRARFAPPTGPAASPEAPAAAEKASGTVIARYDFEDGLRNEWLERVVDHDGKKCLLAASLPPDEEWFSSRADRSFDLVLGEDTRMTVRYLLDRGEQIKLQCSDATVDDNASEEKDAVVGAWTTVTFFMSRMARAAPGHQLTNINILAGTPGVTTRFLIDEIVIHEGELAAERAEQAAPEPAVAPPGPPGKVLYAQDFEEGYVTGWTGSTFEPEDGRSRRAFKASAIGDRHFSTRMVMVGVPKLKGENLAVFFRYKLLDPAPEIKFQISNDTLKAPCYKFLKPVLGVWQPVCIPFSELKVEREGKYEPGHVMSPGFILAGKPGSPVRLFVDDLVFFDGGAPEGIARDLAPPWAPKAVTRHFSDFEGELNGLRGVESCPGAVGKGVRTSGEDKPFAVVYRPRHRKLKEELIAHTSRDLLVAFFVRPKDRIRLVVELEVSAKAGEGLVKSYLDVEPGEWRTAAVRVGETTEGFSPGEDWRNGLPIEGLKVWSSDGSFDLDALWLCVGAKAEDVRSAYQERLRSAAGGRRRPVEKPAGEEPAPLPTDGAAEPGGGGVEGALSFDFEKGAPGWSGGERRAPGFKGSRAYGNKLDEDGLSFSAGFERVEVDARTWVVFACKSAKPRNITVAAETEGGPVRKLLVVPEGRKWVKLAFGLAQGFGKGKAAIEKGTGLLGLKFDSQAALRAGLCSIDEVRLVRASSREEALSALGE